MKPVYIDGCYGVFHPAPGRRGVVLCGSLGDEGLNTYRSQVLLAERLAQAGFPSLRISYRGTGDSDGDDGEPGQYRAWIDSIIAAVRWLRSACGVASVTLCGTRIGAALAAQAASELDDVGDLVMLAPQASGRRFLRERMVIARSVADIWQSHSLIDDGGWFEAHGLRLDHATRDALANLDAGRLTRWPRRVLVLEPSGAPGDNRLVAAARASGADITRQVFDDGDDMLRDSHEAKPPHQAFAAIAGWLGEPGQADQADRDFGAQQLEFPAFHETPVTLGPACALAGILAVPKLRADDAPVVLIPSTGANPRFGNSRGTVMFARWLAAQGIASLRMDGHGIGDAAPGTGDCGRPYSKQGDRDVSFGVDFLVDRFRGPIVVLGMCSGSYHAFQATLNDKRINGLILMNLQKFVWHEGESLSVVQRTTLRTTGYYLRNAVSAAVWRRLLLGQINVAGIVRALAGRAARQIAAAADPAIAAINGETQVGMVRRQVAELSCRNVQILYALSGNDPGLDEISEYFGPFGWRLRRYRNVMFHTIKGADHTLSAHWARERLMQAMAVFLRQRFGVPISAQVSMTEVSRPVAGTASVLEAAIGSPANVIDSAPTAA